MVYVTPLQNKSKRASDICNPLTRRRNPTSTSEAPNPEEVHFHGKTTMGHTLETEDNFRSNDDG
jgi:hypothetical protein